MHFSRGNHFHQKTTMFGCTGYKCIVLQTFPCAITGVRSVSVEEYMRCDPELLGGALRESVCMCVFKREIQPQIVHTWV